jgi:hypothetical protein
MPYSVKLNPPTSPVTDLKRGDWAISASHDTTQLLAVGDVLFRAETTAININQMGAVLSNTQDLKCVVLNDDAEIVITFTKANEDIQVGKNG